MRTEMPEPEFNIFISGTTSSTDDWKRALEAPMSELPPLSEEQKDFARRFKVSDEEYARGVLAGKYGESAQRERALKLGDAVVQVLSGLGPQYRLLAVIREAVNFRWVLRIETPIGIRNVQVALDLADDVIDSGVFEVLEQLKQKVVAGVGRLEFAKGNQQ